MAIRRKTNFRRKSTNKRRKFNISKPRPSMNLKFQDYRFIRSQPYKETIVGNTTLPTQKNAVVFRLSDLPAYTEFTNLFDRFRITGVKYRWVINRDPDTSDNRVFPVIRWVHDYDDSTSSGDYQVLSQYPRMKEFWFSGNRQTSRWYFMRPSTLDVGYESATLSSYEPSWKKLIDCASYDTPHYGIKYETMQNMGGQSIYLEVKYYLRFKNVR